MAAPVLQAEAAAFNLVTTGDNSPTIPAHLADDILLATVMVWVPATALAIADIPTPANWAKLGSVDLNGATKDGQIAWFWRRATASGTTVTFTRGALWDTGNDGAYGARVDVIRGCATSGNPYDAFATAGQYNTSNQNTPAVTVSGSERLVMIFEAHCTDIATAHFTGLTGFTLGTHRGDVGGTGGGARNARLETGSSHSATATTHTAAAAGRFYAFGGISFKPVVAVPHTHSQPDTIAGTDARALKPGKTQADTATVTDANTKAVTRPPQADTIAGTDAQTRAAAFIRGAQSNLLPNPSFEVDTAGWVAQGTGPVLSRVTNESIQGSAALQVVTDGSTFDLGARTTTITGLTIGVPYTASVWVKAPASASMYLRLTDVTVSSADTNWTASGAWERKSVTLTPAATTLQLHARVASNVAYTFFVDGAMLEQSSAASPYFEGLAERLSATDAIGRAVAIAAPARGPNIHTNPSAVTDLTGWSTTTSGSFNTGGTMTRVTGVGCPSGDDTAIRFVSSGSGLNYQGAHHSISNALKSAYKVSFWARRVAGTDAGEVFVDVVGYPGSYAITSSEWTRYEFTLTDAQNQSFTPLRLGVRHPNSADRTLTVEVTGFVVQLASTERLAATDSISAVVARGYQAADTLSITDALALLQATYRTIEDTAGVSDSVTISVGEVEVVLDSGSISDAISLRAAQSQADTASATDAAAKTSAKTQADTASATDSISIVQNHILTINDTASATDAVSKQATKAFADAAFVLDRRYSQEVLADSPVFFYRNNDTPPAPDAGLFQQDVGTNLGSDGGTAMVGTAAVNQIFFRRVTGGDDKELPDYSFESNGSDGTHIRYLKPGAQTTHLWNTSVDRTLECAMRLKAQGLGQMMWASSSNAAGHPYTYAQKTASGANVTIGFAPRGNAGGSVSWTIAAADWPVDVWKHVVFTWSGSTKTAELFLEGVSQGTRTSSVDVNGIPGFGPIFGAWYTQGVFNTWSIQSGTRFDNTAWYPSILTATRIAAHNAARNTVFEPVWNAVRTVADTATATDSISIKLTKAVGDTATVADTAGFQRSLNLADEAEATDVQAKQATRVQADAAQVTDAQGQVLNYVRTIADGISSSDSIALVEGNNVTIDDTGVATDSVGKAASRAPIADSVATTDVSARATSKTASDAVTATDATSIRLTKAVADLATVTDSAFRGLAKTAADTATIADDIQTQGEAGGASLTHDVDDSVAATDAQTKAVAKTQTDAITGTDSVTAVEANAVSVADTIGATDSIALVQAHSLTLADTVAGADSTTVTEANAAQVADTASVSDNISAVQSHAKSLNDGATATDATSAVRAAALAINDSATAADASTRHATKSQSDTATSTDAQTRAQGHGRSVDDAAVGTDAQTKAVQPAKADTAAATDAQSTRPSKTVADTAQVTDAQTTQADFTRTITDSITGTDSLSGAGADSATVDDSVSVTDSIQTQVNYKLAFSDGLQAADAIGKTPRKAVVDSVTISDSVQPQAGYKLTLNDGAAAADATGKASRKTVADPIAASDALSRAWQAVRTQSDAAAAADEQVLRSGFSRLLADNALLADSILARTDVTYNMTHNDFQLFTAPNADFLVRRSSPDDDARYDAGSPGGTAELSDRKRYSVTVGDKDAP